MFVLEYCLWEAQRSAQKSALKHSLATASGATQADHPKCQEEWQRAATWEEMDNTGRQITKLQEFVQKASTCTLRSQRDFLKSPFPGYGYPGNLQKVFEIFKDSQSFWEKLLFENSLEIRARAFGITMNRSSNRANTYIYCLRWFQCVSSFELRHQNWVGATSRHRWWLLGALRAAMRWEGWKLPGHLDSL